MQHVKEFLQERGVEVKCVFLPFTQSRSCEDKNSSWWKAPNNPSLNWIVTVFKNGIDRLVTNFSQGIGHIPGYRLSFGGISPFQEKIYGKTIEKGIVPPHQKPHVATPGKLPPPSTADILYCLISDGSCYFDSLSFEEWAAEYGYDLDSRKAERYLQEGGNTMIFTKDYYIVTCELLQSLFEHPNPNPNLEAEEDIAPWKRLVEQQQDPGLVPPPGDKKIYRLGCRGCVCYLHTRMDPAGAKKWMLDRMRGEYRGLGPKLLLAEISIEWVPLGSAALHID